MQGASDLGDNSTVDGSFSHDIDMNGIPTISSSGAGGFDSCGYEADIVFSVDTRNSKWQARNNGMSQAAASKSFNHKNYMKYMQRRNDKIEREQHKIQQEQTIRQIQQENRKWAPVDEEDARHMQREAAKRQKEQQKLAKKLEKKIIEREEEEKNQKANNRQDQKQKAKKW